MFSKFLVWKKYFEMALQSFLIISSTRKVCKILNMVSVISFCKDKAYSYIRKNCSTSRLEGNRGLGFQWLYNIFNDFLQKIDFWATKWSEDSQNIFFNISEVFLKVPIKSSKLTQTIFWVSSIHLVAQK